MISKPRLLMQEPRQRPITIRLPLGGLGDVLALGPALEFCGRGHPRSEKWVQVPSSYLWVYQKCKFATRVTSIKGGTHQPSLEFKNEIFLQTELQELSQHGRVLSRAERLAAMVGNSLVMRRRPWRIPTETSILKRFQTTYSKQLVVVALEASSPSRSYAAAPVLFEKLRGRFPNMEVVDLCQRINGKFRWSVAEITALIEVAAVVIAVDSGPIHIANSMGKRVVALLGYTAVPGFLDYNNQKLHMVTAGCLDKADACLWEIGCRRGTMEQREARHVPCLSVDPDLVVEKTAEALGPQCRILAVMPTWNNLLHTRMAVESIDSKHDVDLLLIDNGSTDGSMEFFKRNGWRCQSLPKSSVAEAQNIGLKEAVNKSYDFVLLMNNDVVLSNYYVDELVSLMSQQSDVGLVVGCGLEKGDRSWISEAPRTDKTEEMHDLVRGSYSATLIKTTAIRAIGIFDTNFQPRYIEDNDFNLRLNLAGFRTMRTSAAVFFHDVGTTVKKVVGNARARDQGSWEINKNYFKEKWGSDVHTCSQQHPKFTVPFNGDKQKWAARGLDEIHGAFK